MKGSPEPSPCTWSISLSIQVADAWHFCHVSVTLPQPPSPNSWQSCWAPKSPDLRLTKGTAHTSHNSPFFALSPAVRGWKGLSFLLLGRRGEGLQGERVIGRNRSSFLSVTHVDSATLSYVGPRSTCHFGIWHWHPPPPHHHTHTNSLLTLQTSIR